ncbi:serine/threonine-protein kinase [Actinomadura viridis]|uniref:serine/threonine-protein kinase n=1 Tax=Actinomadura viridis TaxID=58110 RepID=UPI0036BD710A
MSDGEGSADAPREDGRLVGGRYRLLTAVGRGGMGTVWRAHDEMLDREVAVKEVLLRRELSDQERADRHRRTLREARASARLNHPGVVTVHDVVDEDDRPWIVMELVRARSLQEILDAEGPLPPSRTAGIGRQVVGALRAAHAIGILHRDVKPANVLITAEDRAVLTDFGIAQVAGDVTLTQTGLLVGSPAYMSPERVRGERAIPASDLWALGATLYAACEGRPPHHRGDAMAVLAAVMTQEPPAPRNAGPLCPVLHGLLRRDPVQRLRAEQAEEMLGRVAAGAALAVAAGGGAQGRAASAPPAERTPGVPAPRRPEAPMAAPPAGGVPVPDVPVPDVPVPDTAGRVPLPAGTAPGGMAAPGGAAGRKRRTALTLVLPGVLAALVMVGAAVVVLWPGGGTADSAEPRTSTPATNTPAGTRGPTGPAGSPPGGQGASPGPVRALPPGLKRASGPGYTIGVPQGWTREERGNSTFWLDPASDAYVQVDRTGWSGDPYEHWRQWEREVRARNSLPGYRRINLTRSSAGGVPAADLDFVWNGTRAKDRGLVFGGRSYAVLVAVPASRWNEYRPTVNNVIDTFRPRA